MKSIERNYDGGQHAEKSGVEEVGHQKSIGSRYLKLRSLEHFIDGFEALTFFLAKLSPHQKISGFMPTHEDVHYDLTRTDDEEERNGDDCSKLVLDGLPCHCLASEVVSRTRRTAPSGEPLLNSKIKPQNLRS